MSKQLLDAFYEIITEAKQEKYDQIAAERTRRLAVVVENLYQEHNASAVMRTCDCFGIQDLHIIERDNKFAVNRDIAMGAGKWVDQYTYSDLKYPTTKCLNHLKNEGYKIVATTPHTTDNTIFNIDLSQPIALIFGTEQHGLTETALSLADEHVNIPMYGFTESFNISVSAALCLQALRNRLEEQKALDWKLNEVEQIALKIEWCKKIIKNPENVERGLRKRLGLNS